MARSEHNDGSRSVVLFAALLLLCCGLPLLLLSGVSLVFVAPYWPALAGVLALFGLIGFVWYLERGCATCPRNKGRCPARPHSSAAPRQSVPRGL